MNIIYILGSFISTLGSIILLIGFFKNFKNLNLIQKSGIILVEIGVIIPFLLGFMNGFINAFIIK